MTGKDALRAYVRAARTAGDALPPLSLKPAAAAKLATVGASAPRTGEPARPRATESEGGFSLLAEEAAAAKPAKAQPMPVTRLTPPVWKDLAAMNAAICGCQKCPLGRTRTKFVFGEGDPKAQIVFVGEAPGENEDLQGRPFVGRAGKLLDQLLTGAGLSRSSVFICNVLKCRPPGNRAPLPSEIEQCEPYLFAQLALLSPKVVVCLGAPAAQTLLRTKKSIGAIRGQVFDFAGRKLIPTYHPAFLLRPNGAPMIPTVRDDLAAAKRQAAA